MIQIQPAEGIQLHFQTKVPDAGMQAAADRAGASTSASKFAGGMPEAYQRLLLDVMHGDASLFSRADEVELAWGIVDPIAAGVGVGPADRRSRCTRPAAGARPSRPSGCAARAASGSTSARCCSDGCDVTRRFPDLHLGPLAHRLSRRPGGAERLQRLADAGDRAAAGGELHRLRGDARPVRRQRDQGAARRSGSSASPTRSIPAAPS